MKNDNYNDDNDDDNRDSGDCTVMLFMLLWRYFSIQFI